MPEQNLHEADVYALLEEPSGEGMAKAVRPEMLIETTGCPSSIEGLANCFTGNVSCATAAGEEPLGAAMDIPNLVEHGQYRLGQWQGAFLVALADDLQEHARRVDGRAGQGDGFADPQAAGVDQRKTGTVDRMGNRRDQAPAVLVASNVGKALTIR